MKFQNNKQNMGKISAEILQKVVVHDFLWHPVLVSPVFFKFLQKTTASAKPETSKKTSGGVPPTAPEHPVLVVNSSGAWRCWACHGRTVKIYLVT